MFFTKKMNCSRCGKEIGENETIAILANVNELNGIGHVRKFAEGHTVVCSKCFNAVKTD